MTRCQTISIRELWVEKLRKQKIWAKSTALTAIGSMGSNDTRTQLNIELSVRVAQCAAEQVRKFSDQLERSNTMKQHMIRCRQVHPQNNARKISIATHVAKSLVYSSTHPDREAVKHNNHEQQAQIQARKLSVAMKNYWEHDCVLRPSSLIHSIDPMIPQPSPYLR
jgi:hypothetical protein